MVYGKPHPDLFLLATECCGVAPADCLVIEDSRAGIEAARRAGMQRVGISSAYESSNDLRAAGATIVIADMRVLPGIIARLTNAISAPGVGIA